MPREPRTLLEHCIARGGFRKGVRVAQFVTEWAVCSSALGREVGIEEFSIWWKDADRRTAYRRLAEFRQHWPEHHTPQPLADAILAGSKRPAQAPALLSVELTAA